MEDWLKITLVLCLFGTLREIRPSEPFVTEFLAGEWRNITEEQLNQEVYPVGTYSYLGLLVVVFLVTDFLRFKPIIILSGLSGISVYAVLLWTSSIEWVQVSQFLYGLYMATEVAYLTYIYAKVDPDKYPAVSSYTRIAALTGRFLSGVSSQLLTHFDLMNYRDLNYITLVAQILATFWAFWLPPVPYGIYFHRRSRTSLQMDITHTNKQTTPSSPSSKEDEFIDRFWVSKEVAMFITNLKESGNKEGYGESSIPKDVADAAVLITRHARSAYTRPKVLVWSALYAAALALFVLAQTNVQILWKRVQGESDATVAYNGAVEAILTLLGALGAFLASSCTRACLPAPVAAVQGVATFVGTYVPNVFASYIGYIVMGMLFHYTITLASAKIASQLSDESCFGLIFGINTLIGTGLQSLLTLILIQTLRLPITGQYFTISGLYLLLASAWLLGWIVHLYKQNKSINITNQYG